MSIPIHDTSVQRSSSAGSGSTQIQNGEKFRIKSGSDWILELEAPENELWGINIVINIIKTTID